MAKATEFRFECPVRTGLHARPASMLAETAGRFRATVTIRKAAPRARAVDIASVLSVVGLDVKFGDACVIAAAGKEAAAAIAALKSLIEGNLAAECEHAAAVAEAAAARLPISLRRLGIPHAVGRSVSSGFGEGKAVLLDGFVLSDKERHAKPRSAKAESASVRTAIAAVVKDLTRRAKAAASEVERELLKAHGQIANDAALWARIERAIRKKRTAVQAVAAAADEMAAELQCAESVYIRERAMDIQDVCMQILDRLTSKKLSALHPKLTYDSVIFAPMLTANQLLRLESRRLKGLVLGGVGATSHTVILARSMAIPTLIDVEAPAKLVSAGEPVIVDAASGFVITRVAPEVKRYYERQRNAHERRSQRLEPIARRAAVTGDGRTLEVGANASTADEIAGAVSRGADGVGLLRTELLFLDRPAAPTESEQVAAYSAALKAAGGRPVIIRTFDIGGDKPASYLKMVREENPFLGERGIRLYHRFPELLRTQLRAILRASSAGTAKIMAPMVATPAEARWFRAQVEAARAELDREGAAAAREIPVGVMVEVPALAAVIDQVCAEVDFLSIGTNDLCQYWMAVDRGNSAVAPLYNPLNPSFIRVLRSIVGAARSAGRWIGVCGEMAGVPRHLPIMIGLGVDEISVAPGEIAALKSMVHGADASRCRALVDAMAECRDAQEVEALIQSGSWRHAAATPILTLETIHMECDAASKEEAIRDAVDLLYIAGRTEHPHAVEEAVWAREETYSTGLGFGFAIPHCKSAAVTAPTLALLRLKNRVEWGSMDGEPVSTVILLAIPSPDSSGVHLKVFSKLARKLMHEEFRGRLQSASDRNAIERTLSEELELGSIGADR